ncbi:flavin reductase family protein [Nocardioides endophyticus]|uniref:flavin reductase family protein n=1 Tax=Nocardioides endophyticus TaxID=1353775 RepID=UPI0031ECBB10
MFRRHPAGAALLTAEADGRRVAMTLTSLISVSATPFLVAFSVSESSSSAPVMANASRVVAHLLGAKDIGLAVLGATSGIDRFRDQELWTRNPSGAPVFLTESPRLEAQILNRVRAGAATLYVAEVVAVSLGQPGGDPLVYHEGTWRGLGARVTEPA